MRHDITSDLSTSERVHVSLRSRILQGELRGGQRLIVRELAAEYKTSDLPVREAIRMLQGDGLVVVNKNRGACIISLTPEDIAGALLLRGEIEALAVRLAGPNFTESDVAELTRMAEEMDRLASKKATSRYVEINKNFHALLLARCPYANIRREVETLWDGKFDFGYIFGIDTRQLRHSSSHHLQLVERLAAGDWEGAANVSRARKLEVARFLLEALDQPVPLQLNYGDSDDANE